MEILADAMPDKAAIPRSTDGMVDIQSLLRLLAEQVVNAIMDEEADQLCGDGANSRNGYRDRSLETCVGTLNLRIPKLRTGSFFPEDVLERYQRVDRALVAAVAEMYATGTSTRKVQRIAEKMGIERLGRDRVSAIAATLDAEIADLAEGPLDARAIPYIWLDATYVKCRRGGRVASTAVVTAIGCDESGWRRVLGVSVVDTESYESWLGFLRKLRDRGATGTELVVSDAHGGLVRAVGEVFQGAAWQRCAVHLMRDCMREAGSWQLRRRVGRIVSSVFRARDAATAVAMYHAACEMLEGCCPRAARVLEEAEPDALAYLDFPPSHWKRLRTNNVQERANRELKRRSRVVQVFPSRKLLIRMMGAVFAEMDEDWAGLRWFNDESMGRAVEGTKVNAPAPAYGASAAEHAAGIIEPVVADNPVPGRRVA